MQVRAREGQEVERRKSVREEKQTCLSNLNTSPPRIRSKLDIVSIFSRWFNHEALGYLFLKVRWAPMYTK